MDSEIEITDMSVKVTKLLLDTIKGMQELEVRITALERKTQPPNVYGTELVNITKIEGDE